MGVSSDLVGDLAKEYLKKFPGLSSRKIAQKLVMDFPGEFRDEELARTRVRYYRGASGIMNRSSMNQDNYTPKIIVPKDDSHDMSPYVIPDDAYPILAAGDVHLPYHDQEAVEIMLERAIEIKAKTLLIAGDWMDMYQVSRFQKDPRLRNVKAEIDMFNGLIDSIQKALPETKLIFKVGNHEKRFDDYLMSNAAALFDLEEMHLENILKLKSRGIDFVQSMRVMRFRHLNIIHGHEYVFSISNPVNPARGLFTRAKKSTMCFHHHRSSEHTETTITGDVITCWSVGCLCDLKPEYMPLNSWNLGFAEIYGDDNGDYHVNNRRIVNYRLM